LDQAEQHNRPDLVLFAGDVLNDVDHKGLGNRTARNIQRELKKVMQAQENPVHQRRLAGLRLGDSGWLPDELDDFVFICKGEFLRGDKQEKAWIEYDYWIEKYPVTNAQYKKFIDQGGYAEPMYWTREGWKWRKDKDCNAPNYRDNAERSNPLFPVVGVSWYEALAYCHWLNQLVTEDPVSFGLTTTAVNIALFVYRPTTSGSGRRGVRMGENTPGVTHLNRGERILMPHGEIMKPENSKILLRFSCIPVEYDAKLKIVRFGI